MIMATSDGRDENKRRAVGERSPQQWRPVSRARCSPAGDTQEISFYSSDEVEV